MRVHEETWRDEPLALIGTHKIVPADPDGALELAYFVNHDGLAEGRARLAACAPEIARFLLAIMEAREERREHLRQAHEHPGDGENLDTELIRDLLRRAGVIE